MNQLKYSFFHLTAFQSFSRVHHYDRPQEVINDEEISINFPSFYITSQSSYLDERKATPFLIEELKKHLELDTFGYKIVDVHAGDKCKFSIRLPGSYRGNHEMRV